MINKRYSTGQHNTNEPSPWRREEGGEGGGRRGRREGREEGGGRGGGRARDSSYQDIHIIYISLIRTHKKSGHLTNQDTTLIGTIH